MDEETTFDKEQNRGINLLNLNLVRILKIQVNIFQNNYLIEQSVIKSQWASVYADGKVRSLMNGIFAGKSSSN